MGKRTILVVDDEPKLVKVVREYLEHDGYRVVSASDGREALSASTKRGRTWSCST
jgi:CheY-like chemotaxis protein